MLVVLSMYIESFLLLLPSVLIVLLYWHRCVRKFTPLVHTSGSMVRPLVDEDNPQHLRFVSSTAATPPASSGTDGADDSNRREDRSMDVDPTEGMGNLSLNEPPPSPRTARRAAGVAHAALLNLMSALRGNPAALAQFRLMLGVQAVANAAVAGDAGAGDAGAGAPGSGTGAVTTTGDSGASGSHLSPAERAADDKARGLALSALGDPPKFTGAYDVDETTPPAGSTNCLETFLLAIEARKRYVPRIMTITEYLLGYLDPHPLHHLRLLDLAKPEASYDEVVKQLKAGPWSLGSDAAVLEKLRGLRFNPRHQTLIQFLVKFELSMNQLSSLTDALRIDKVITALPRAASEFLSRIPASNDHWHNYITFRQYITHTKQAYLFIPNAGPSAPSSAPTSSAAPGARSYAAAAAPRPNRPRPGQSSAGQFRPNFQSRPKFGNGAGPSQPNQQGRKRAAGNGFQQSSSKVKRQEALATGACFACGERGHTVKTCPNKNGFKK